MLCAIPLQCAGTTAAEGRMDVWHVWSCVVRSGGAAYNPERPESPRRPLAAGRSVAQASSAQTVKVSCHTSSSHVVPLPVGTSRGAGRHDASSDVPNVEVLHKLSQDQVSNGEAKG